MSIQKGKRKKSRIRRSPARKDTVLRRLGNDIGDQLPELLHYSGDPRALRLLELLFDPAYRNYSFSKLCERVGISRTDVVDLMRRYQLDHGMLLMARYFPQIAEDLAQDAMSQQVVCGRCDGRGQVKDDESDGNRICPDCEGEGKVRVPGDVRAQRLILEAMGLIR